MSRVALFGGSFDPPHLAHIQVARHLLDSGDFDSVWILPSPQNPLKPASSSFEDRLAMCRLAFADLAPRVEVLDAERNLSGFTIDLIRKLKADRPEQEFSFVCGSDLREEVPRWKEGAELQETLRFVFLPRPPDPRSPFAPIRSTDVRAKAKKGLPLDGLVPKAVEKYIAANQLYSAP